MFATAVVEVLRVRRDAVATRAPDGGLQLVEGHMAVSLGKPGSMSSVLLEGLQRNGGTPRQSLLETAALDRGDGAMLRASVLLYRLEVGGWIERALCASGAVLATLRPSGHVAPAAGAAIDPTQYLRLSRFAHLRSDGDELRVESPLSGVHVALHAPVLAAMVAGFARPATVEQLPLYELGVELDAAVVLARMLRDAAILDDAAVEEPAELAHWAFADLLLHARSRAGRHLGDYGGSYHMRDRADPLPAVQAARSPSIELEPVDLEPAIADDPPYGVVVERRRSIRVHDDTRPITSEQLSEFLFRCARVRATFHDGSQELSSRPYPGGGAVYELEVYPLVHNCLGVAAGLYHYDAAGHALGLVAEPGPEVQLLLEYAQRAGTMAHPPQVTVLLAARFRRAMWKYESMAYALILKHVGVMYQTMYGAATAMGLACCALGGGNADAFAAAAKTSYYEESTVGELTLGSRPPDA